MRKARLILQEAKAEGLRFSLVQKRGKTFVPDGGCCATDCSKHDHCYNFSKRLSPCFVEIPRLHAFGASIQWRVVFLAKQFIHALAR